MEKWVLAGGSRQHSAARSRSERSPARPHGSCREPVPTVCLISKGIRARKYAARTFATQALDVVGDVTRDR